MGSIQIMKVDLYCFYLFWTARFNSSSITQAYELQGKWWDSTENTALTTPYYSAERPLNYYMKEKGQYLFWKKKTMEEIIIIIIMNACTCLLVAHELFVWKTSPSIKFLSMKKGRPVIPQLELIQNAQSLTLCLIFQFLASNTLVHVSPAYCVQFLLCQRESEKGSWCPGRSSE